MHKFFPTHRASTYMAFTQPDPFSATFGGISPLSYAPKLSETSSSTLFDEPDLPPFAPVQKSSPIVRPFKKLREVVVKKLSNLRKSPERGHGLSRGRSFRAAKFAVDASNVSSPNFEVPRGTPSPISSAKRRCGVERVLLKHEFAHRESEIDERAQTTVLSRMVNVESSLSFAVLRTRRCEPSELPPAMPQLDTRLYSRPELFSARADSAAGSFLYSKRKLPVRRYQSDASARVCVLPPKILSSPFSALGNCRHRPPLGRTYSVAQQSTLV